MLRMEVNFDDGGSRGRLARLLAVAGDRSELHQAMAMGVEEQVRGHLLERNSRSPKTGWYAKAARSVEGSIACMTTPTMRDAQMSRTELTEATAAALPGWGPPGAPCQRRMMVADIALVPVLFLCVLRCRSDGCRQRRGGPQPLEARVLGLWIDLRLTHHAPRPTPAFGGAVFELAEMRVNG